MLTEEQLRILKEQARRTADKYISDPKRKHQGERKRAYSRERQAIRSLLDIDDDDIPF